MKKVTILLFFLSCTFSIFAQNERKHVRDGNKKFESENFTESEISYRKAAETQPDYYEARFNLGDALYKQKKFEEAAKTFTEIADQAPNSESKARSYHNLGNSLLQMNKLEESIEAYKQSLRHNPNDLETKYNLAFAQDKLKQQQQQQQQNQDNKQNQDKNQNQQQNKDQQQNQDQNKDQQDQQDKQNQNKDQQQNGDQQEQPLKISKEDAERLLQALQNDEKEVQEKVKKEKAKAKKVKTTKNW